MEQRYRRLIWKYHNKYYLSNMAYNEDKKRELMSHVGPLALSAHLFLDKMDCAIQYERHDLPGNPVSTYNIIYSYICSIVNLTIV